MRRFDKFFELVSDRLSGIVINDYFQARKDRGSGGEGQGSQTIDEWVINKIPNKFFENRMINRKKSMDLKKIIVEEEEKDTLFEENHQL